MAKNPQLLDHRGNPVERGALLQKTVGPTTAGLLSPVSGYPGDGLTPVRLAAILRAADMGDPIRYLELAETIEERDLHFAGVLGTRRRSVSQIDITVEAASDEPQDVARADMVRAWLKRDELTEEIFDILDCIGKGVSYTWIEWDTSEGQWMPGKLETLDPRLFGVDRLDLKTPTVRNEFGSYVPLDAYRFIVASIKAKSGLPLRSGLSRIAMWAYLFKKYTERDWAVFTQTYGQPLRLGKWGAGASEADKETLFRAVANIAGDCAAIIPEGMSIEFVQSGAISATGELYQRRADWLDQQVSKCVLGQTATTDSVTGGLGSGKEHRQVQEDIERSDAKALAAILNRDLIRPWMNLEFGVLKAYPRLIIARPETEDLARLARALGTLVPLGLRVSASEVRDKFGLSEPKADEELLGAQNPAIPGGPAQNPPATAKPGDPVGSFNGVEAFFKRGKGGIGTQIAQQAETASTGEFSGVDHEALLAARMAADSGPAFEVMLEQIEAMLAAAGSLDEAREMLMAAFPELESAGLASMLASGLLAAGLAGRAAAEDAANG